MLIPNCIHSYRLNMLAKTLRSFTFNNQENIRIVLEVTRKLTKANCIVYKAPKGTSLKVKEIFCRKEEYECVDENKETFDKLCNYDMLARLKKTVANMNDEEECFYYSIEDCQDEEIKDLFNKLGIKCLIVSLISIDIKEGIVCAIFKDNFDITKADLDTISFIGSIIKTEEQNYSMYLKLKYRIAFENLLTTIATRFSELPNDKMVEAINTAIKDLGTFLKIDRTYLYKINNTSKEFIKEFEWAAPGIKSWKKDVLTESQYDWILENMKKYDVMVIEDINKHTDIPPKLKEFLSERKVKTLLLIPISIVEKENEHTFQGFFGFSCECDTMNWTDEIKNQMKIVSYMLGTALKRMSLSQKTKNIEKTLDTSIDEWTKDRAKREKEREHIHNQLSDSLKMLKTIATRRQMASN